MNYSMFLLRFKKYYPDYSWFFLVFASVGIVQLLYLLIPGPFWDDWIYSVLYKRGDQLNFIQAFIDNGRPLGGWMLWKSMDWMGPILGPRILISLSVIGAAISIYLTFKIRNLCNPSSAALIAIISCTVPAMQTGLTSVMLQFYIGFFAFYFGLYLFVSSDTYQGYLNTLCKSLAIIISLFSVASAEAPLALIPLYPIILTISKMGGHINLIQLLLAWREYFYYSLILVVFGGITLLGTFYLYPTTGDYKGAHELSFNVSQLFSNTLLYLSVLSYSYAIFLIPLVSLYFYVGRPNIFNLINNKLVWLGFIVFILGIAPYLFSGRIPSYLGWELRVFLFSGLGIGLILLAISIFLANKQESILRKRIIFIICILSILNLLSKLPLWSARQIKDDFVAAGLNIHKDTLLSTGLIWINDNNWNVTHYRAYEWTGLAQTALERNNLIALSGDNRTEGVVKQSITFLLNGCHLASGPINFNNSYELQIKKLPFWWEGFSIIALTYRTIATKGNYLIFLNHFAQEYISIEKSKPTNNSL